MRESGIILDVETRIDRVLLAASGRARAPKEMPVPLLSITAAATLHYDVDQDGSVASFRLTGWCASDNGERSVLLDIERELARAWSEGAELVTYNGSHDLAVVRYGLLRNRLLGLGGAARWSGSGHQRHWDLMRHASPAGRWPSLADVAAGLGFAAPDGAGSRTCGAERAKAELDVVRTLLLRTHLSAERAGDPVALARGVVSIRRFLAAQLIRRPHLGPLLASPLFSSAGAAIRTETAAKLK